MQIEKRPITAEDMRQRCKAYSLRVVKLATSLPNTMVSQVFARQIVRSGTSVAANYRAACRARSHAEFVSKIGIVEEEADETLFWIEMIVDAGLVSGNLVESLCQEGKEILAIVTATRKTAKSRRNT